MPLCGTKKSKKQKRDPSPPYARDSAVDSAAEAKLRALEEDLVRERKAYNELKSKYDQLKADTGDGAAVSKSLFGNLNATVEDTEKKFKEKEAQLENEIKQKNAEAKKKIEEEFESKKKQMEEEKKKLTDQLNQTKAKLESEVTERAKIEGEKEKIKREKDTVEATLNITKKELDIAKKESHIPRSPTRAPTDEWKAKIATAETELKRERDQRMEKERDFTRLVSESELAVKEKEALRQELDSLKSTKEEALTSMKRNLENSEMNHKNELSKLEETISTMKLKLEEETSAKESLMTRLSQATAASVLDSNPKISDLSDLNRPQKLGDKFASVFENQWTQASEALENTEKNEEEIVRTLLQLLIAIYNHCKEASEAQLSRIEEDIFLPPLEHAPSLGAADTNGKEIPALKSPTSKQSMSKIPRFSSHKGRPSLPNLSTEKKTIDTETNGKDRDKPKRSLSLQKVKGEKFPEIPAEVRKGIKEYRKVVSKQVIPVIEKEVTNKLRNNTEFGDRVVDACKPFITQCVELCWLMNIQDPPVCLSWKVPNDRSFDTEVYSAHLQGGSYIEYVVWPAMYLHEGGRILMKGKAQGFDE